MTTAAENSVAADVRAREIESMVRENRRRYSRLMEKYDPLTGCGAPGERTLLQITDFAIPWQEVPVEMMGYPLIRRLAEAGSIAAYIETCGLEEAPSFEDVSFQIRRIRHRCDFLFWAYCQIHLLGKEGGVVRFVLNKAQLKLYDTLERLRRKGRIDVIVLKARQWGGSTLCLFYQWWLALEWDPTYSFSVLAQTVGIADDIASRMDFALQNYDAWDLYLPKDERLRLTMKQKGNEYTLKDSRGGEVRHNRVRIGSIIAPDNLRGLPGRGAHFSEMGVWPDTPGRRPMDLIKSITAAIPRRRNTMVVIESTAKGAGSEFHKEWLRATSGQSTFAPVFVAWWENEYDVLPVSDEYAFAAWLYDHRSDVEAKGDWLDAGKYYWYQWELGATFQGIEWYRTERKTYSAFGDMASENPTDSIEAFQNSGRMVFDIYDIERLARMCREPAQRGRLFSDETTGAGVLRNITFESMPDGKLLVWEMPDRSLKMTDRYVVVVDVGGRRSTSDWSVIRVLDRFPLMTGGRVKVVATMRYHVDPDLLAYDAMRVAAWYDDALLVIESNTLEIHDKNRQVDGGQSQYVLDIVGGLYPNLYARRTALDSIEGDIVNKWGFHTNVSTKPAIIGNLISCLRETAYVERYSVMIDELAIYEEKDNQFNAMAGAGNHDDVLMATAIGLWVALKEMDVPRIIQPTVTRDRTAARQNSAAIL